MAKATKKPRTTSDYLNTAKKGKAFVPSLQKYSRRKSLSRWEKAAITRAANNIAKASRGGTLVPLSKKQAKALKTKDPLVGHGIRAVRMRSVTLKKATVSVEKGELIVKQAGRKWHYIVTPPDLPSILDTAADIFERNKNRTVRMTIWTGAGRLPQTFATLEEIIAFFTEFINKYRALSPQFDEWFEGITYTVDRPKKKG